MRRKSKYIQESLTPIELQLLNEFREKNTNDEFLKIFPADILVLEIGMGLIPLLSEELEDNLLDRIRDLRIKIGIEFGIVIPLIRIVDHKKMNPFDYCLKIHGMEYAKKSIENNNTSCFMTNNKVWIKTTGNNIEPVSIVIDKNKVRTLANIPYLNSIADIVLQIETVIKNNLDKLFNYDASVEILCDAYEMYPILVKETLKKYTPIRIKKVLEYILSKQKPVNNINRILELMLYYCGINSVEKIGKKIVKEIQKKHKWAN